MLLIRCVVYHDPEDIPILTYVTNAQSHKKDDEYCHDGYFGWMSVNETIHQPTPCATFEKELFRGVTVLRERQTHYRIWIHVISVIHTKG